jgi:predicted enzyme related to lactoylglutathione lyase
MSPQSNAVGWFEIPALDMDRAMKFYETVFDVKLERHQMGPLDMAWFPSLPEGKGAAGSLVKYEDWYKPTTDGPLLYFTAHSGDLKNEVSRIEAAGGKLVVPIKQISPEYGWMACAIDTEGNRFAIHSREHAA